MHVNSVPGTVAAVRRRARRRGPVRRPPELDGRLRSGAELTVGITADPEPELLLAWDRLVLATENSDVAQLSGWAAVRRRAGYHPLYLLATCDGELVGGAALLWRRVPGLGKVSYLPYGPSLAPDLDDPAAVRRRLTATLAEVGRSHAAMFVQPPDGGNEVSVDLLQRGFRFSQAGIAPSATWRVCVDRSEDELRAALNRRLRTWTRQWTDRGVTVRVGGEADIPTLARLAAGTALHQGFAPFPTEYLEALHRELAPGGHVLLLIGELDGEPVAAELMTGCGGALKSRVTGLDRSSDRAVKLNVASAMIWEAMRWARAHGYRWFDFGGLRPESVAVLDGGRVDPGALAGPDQFKTKFGGEMHAYPPAVELIPSRVVRAGYDLLRRGEGGQRLLSSVKEALRGVRSG